jgi:hypothetical protein
MLLAVPAASLATKKARALLPESYSKADAVFNVQRVSLLTAAFAQGRLDLLATAMQDRMHQPYPRRRLPAAEDAAAAGCRARNRGRSAQRRWAVRAAVSRARDHAAGRRDPSRALLDASVEVLYRCASRRASSGRLVDKPPVKGAHASFSTPKHL